jgi:flagellar motility protein MotE (MotC chaperone)
MPKSSISSYYEALERLVSNRPINVPKGSKITNDTVSREAGRGVGSIKKSRSQFADLIDAISKAAESQRGPVDVVEQKLARKNAEIKRLQEQLDSVLGNYILIYRELIETRKKLSKLTGENVLPLYDGVQKI